MTNNRKTADRYFESVADQLAKAAGATIKRDKPNNKKAEDKDDAADRILAGIGKYLDDQTQIAVASTQEIVKDAKNIVEPSDKEKFARLIKRLKAHETIEQTVM